MARTSYIWWDDNDILIVLDQHAEFDYIVLAHWNNRQQVDMSLHSRHIIQIPIQPAFALSP